jgi:hypothetical protein
MVGRRRRPRLIRPHISKCVVGVIYSRGVISRLSVFLGKVIAPGSRWITRLVNGVLDTILFPLAAWILLAWIRPTRHVITPEFAKLRVSCLPRGSILLVGVEDVNRV